MRKRGLVYQSVEGSAHVSLLTLTHSRHREWAESHGCEYRAMIGHQGHGRSAHWSKIALAREFLAEGWEWLLWMDADVLVERLECDPADAMPQGILGGAISMVRGPTEWAGQPWEWNTGVIAMTTGVELSGFLEEVWSSPCPGAPCFEQTVVGLLAPRYSHVIKSLPLRWNHMRPDQHPMPPDEPAIIRAWHGCGPNDAIHSMAIRLAEIQTSAAADSTPAAPCKNSLSICYA
jgi:hypothetical protein